MTITIQEIIYFIVLLISAFFYIKIFGRKPLRNIIRILLLVVADAGFISFFYHHNSLNMFLFILLMLIGNILAIRKIISGNNPEQAQMDVWHDNPDNWKSGFIYYNPEDKRIFPPKKMESFGWTINFANPYSILAMIGLILLMILLTQFLK